MEKNVGSVDLEELKRAREALNQERGIENDPNMYSNYNPNRSAEEESSSTANSTPETQTNSGVENAAQAEYSGQSNPAEHGATFDVQNEESEANYETAYSDETDETTSETASDLDVDQTAEAEDYSSETQTSNLAETYENSTPYEAETSETQASYGDEGETATSEQADPSTRYLAQEPSTDEFSQTEVSETDQNFQVDESTDDNEMADDEDDNEILKALFGDDYKEIKKSILDEVEQANGQESDEDSDIVQDVDAASQEGESQETVVENGDYAVNDEEYKQIIGDEKTDNGMRVTLPNLNKEDIARKNFDVYDNFAQFEVHYTPPTKTEVETESDENPNNEFADEIKNILYGSEEGDDHAQSEMGGAEEQSGRTHRYSSKQQDFPTEAVDMASHGQNSVPTSELKNVNEEEDEIDQEYNEIRAEEGDLQTENEGAMSDIVSEKINESEYNSLSNAVEDNQNTSELDETESAPESLVEETGEDVEVASEIEETGADVDGAGESQETESELHEPETPESTETLSDNVSVQSETGSDESLTENSSADLSADQVDATLDSAKQEENTVEQEATSTPTYVHNPEFDELPEHDYANEDVISRENSSYISTTSVNYADLNNMYEKATKNTSTESNSEETTAQAGAETTPVGENQANETATTGENGTADATTESSATNSTNEDIEEDIELDDSLISFSSGTSEGSGEEKSESDVEVENSAGSTKTGEESETNSAPHKTFAEIEEYSYIDAIVDDNFKNSGKYSILLGKKENGEYEFATIEKGYNLAIFGDTASNTYQNLISSAILSLMLKNTSEEVKFLICDADSNTKLGGLCKNTFVSGEQVYTEKESILENLMGISKELDERYKMLAKMRVRSVEDYNKLAAEIGTSLLPYNVVVLSNFQNLNNFDNVKEINALLFNLLKFGRIVGIYVIVGSSAPILSNEINYNLPSRISLKTDDEMQSTAFVGSADATYLEDKNDVIFSKIDCEPQHLKVAKLSKNELKLILQNIED